MKTAADSIDECHETLHAAGWSIGETAVDTPSGMVWMVFAHRGEHRIVAKAQRQAEAWTQAARMACLDEFTRAEGGDG